MKLLTGFLVALIFVSTASGQSDDPTKTWGYQNGRWWNNASPDLRLGYMLGHDEGRIYHCPTCGAKDWFPTGTTNGDVIEALNKFYQDPANRQIMVPGAMHLLALRFNGESEAVFQRAVEAVRAVVSKPAPTPAPQVLTTTKQ